MTIDSFADAVIVFDLDDTLYMEADYSQSGVVAVCKELHLMYGRDIKADLLAAHAEKEDVWGRACELLSLPITVKESLLWIYRLHSPNIALESSVRDLLQYMKDLAKHVAVLTDGRSISQRRKLLALNLLDLPVYISEEYESEKPDKGRFVRIAQDLPADQYVYVGDNPKKDFVAPNNLGWLTIGLRGGPRNIHSQETDSLAAHHLPKIWIDDLSDVTSIVQSIGRNGALSEIETNESREL